MMIYIKDFYCSSFEIITSNKVSCSTSSSISRLFNIPLEVYNNLLINKVIKHDLYEIHTFNDITFDLCDISKEIYLNRFKETFSDQLTLLILGGV